MNFNDYLHKYNERLDNGVYRAQFEYGTDEIRKEMLETADLLFEVADKMEEVLTDLMVRQGFAPAAANGQLPVKEAEE